MKNKELIVKNLHKWSWGKRAFTLAEVLITLAIIGVIAAITIPTLIQKCQKQVVETRLKKVYSVMNQAIQMAEAEYGAKEMWTFGSDDFYDKYYAPYLKVLKVETVDFNLPYKYKLIYFPDGSLLAMKTNFHDYFFFPNAKNYSENSLLDNRVNVTGVTLFPFRFAPNVSDSTSVGGIYKQNYNKGFLPYLHNWDGTKEGLISGYYGCRPNNNHMPNFCTAYIMQNGWKIPDDYPFKVR